MNTQISQRLVLPLVLSCISLWAGPSLAVLIKGQTFTTTARKHRRESGIHTKGSAELVRGDTWGDDFCGIGGLWPQRRQPGSELLFA